ncbi:DoxX family protein [Mycolicibacterium moriokaense]|uniref:Membrane protein n=1 Tax=Mycolicibacterium moriokaense TaxID=39691 RepID=A0AAD1H7J1_9MYCO|nr:DoxX family protein [Mycolicibacterium moriokaense]MCV7038981.1 DoxX family protein [Mycolicibacterium moriokaense]ORB20420.1 DoxX family protein [Mycolicibacterium moriokaense]BBW99878.1 putative membrane protein [Mycolicibacterium moriokaense]
MTQRDISLSRLTTTRASGAVVLIRVYVGLIFVGEGLLKFVRPDALGSGRFVKAGIPMGAFLADFDGVLEIVCGLLILVGLFTRLATLPMIGDMVGALGITKLPLLWDHAPLYPSEGGIWDFFHEGRLELAMLCGCLYLLIVGAGPHSVDARVNRSATASREQKVAA